MLEDNRTKPETEWTYYVVDDLPRMSHIFRYDTVEEAIEKYKSLPDNFKSALGSSIEGGYEVDHIHRCNGKNVLVMDSDDAYPWRASMVSAEIQESIDKMIAYLNVQHQYSHLFGKMFPSAIVELERYCDNEIDKYFSDKLLRPEKPRQLITAINEVYAEGHGWMKRDAFLELLNNSAPSRFGEGRKNIVVDRLNIDYIDETGHTGQADLSPRHFVLLQEETIKQTYPVKLSEDLYQFSVDVDFYEAQDQTDSKVDELSLIQRDIASGSLGPYIKYLSEGLSEGFASEDLHNRALSLLSRLTVLTPKEFRKPALASMIRNAEYKTSKQETAPPKKHWIDLQH